MVFFHSVTRSLHTYTKSDTHEFCGLVEKSPALQAEVKCFFLPTYGFFLHPRYCLRVHARILMKTFVFTFGHAADQKFVVPSTDNATQSESGSIIFLLRLLLRAKMHTSAGGSLRAHKPAFGHRLLK